MIMDVNTTYQWLTSGGYLPREWAEWEAYRSLRKG